MKICVVGGGPAGLFFALQVRRYDPKVSIDIFEQNPRDATYGFGVSLHRNALDRVRGYNEDFHDGYLARAVMYRGRLIRVNDQDVFVDSVMPSAAIARIDLLALLQNLCEAAGLTIAFESRMEAPSDFDEYDLVVAADGANSAVRGLFPNAFGTETEVIRNRFAWYGTTKVFDHPGLTFRETDLGGFVGHYYAYSPTMSTFVAECDEPTWFSSGMDGMSDEDRQVLTEKLFAPELGRHPLISNRSIWRNYVAITNRRWVHDKFVLIGDARRAAHPSIGSGTRLAIDDAQTLFEALRDHGPDVEKMCEVYEDRRRPVARKLTDAMEKSYRWYEDFRTHMALDPMAFAYSYMTRTGRLSDDRLAEEHPDFMARWAARRDRDAQVAST